MLTSALPIGNSRTKGYLDRYFNGVNLRLVRRAYSSSNRARKESRILGIYDAY